MYFFRKIKYRIISLKTGVYRPYLWELHYHLGEYILRYLKAFKKMDRSGYPVLSPDDFEGPNKLSNEEQIAKWEKTLDDMIEGFEFLVNYDELMTEYYIKNKNKPNPIFDEFNKQHDEAKKKAHLFVEYFGALWD
jgi:hypothetical protein